MTIMAKNVLLTDVHARNPDAIIGLTRAGVTGIRKVVEISRTNGPPVIMMPVFEIFTDLPSGHTRGNLSRDGEAVNRALETVLGQPVTRIEDVCVDISRHLLETQEYAATVEVRMHGEYPLKRRSPMSRLECQEFYEIFTGAVLSREGVVQKTLGVEVMATTACPCAQEISRGVAFDKLKKLGVSDGIVVEFLAGMPMPTHNQRGIGTIVIESGGDVQVDVETIIGIVENSMSSPMYTLLKREDEKHVVESAHASPKFVEDCVRTMARNLVLRLTDLPDDTMITISQVNEESIHRHNAFAERMAMFGDLKREVLRNGC